MASVFSEDLRSVRGQTICFRKQLEEGILAEQETIREMVPSPFFTSSYAIFVFFLLFVHDLRYIS